MKGRRIHRYEEGEPQINLTSLIDVVFVILILFILIAPILDVDDVQLAVGPTLETTSLTKAGPLSILAKKNNQVLVNGQCVAIDALADVLKRERVLHPEATPELFCDRETHFGIYQKIKSASVEAGFETLHVVLEPSKRT